MKPRPTLIAALVFAAVAGCAPGGNAPKAGPPNDSPKAGVDNAPPSAPTPVDVSKIPSVLKHDAYVYNGFDRIQPLKYMFARMQGEKPSEGTQVAELKSVDKDKAEFSVVRTGSLKDIGEETYEVRPDGIYLLSTSLGSPKEPVMVMPAKVTMGNVWAYDYQLTGTVKGDMTFKGKAKVEREEKVSVGGTSYDTVLINETATIDAAGSKSSVSSKTWYAKGVGVVKMKMEVKDPKGRIITSTIDLAGGN